MLISVYCNDTLFTRKLTSPILRLAQSFYVLESLENCKFEEKLNCFLNRPKWFIDLCCNLLFSGSCLNAADLILCIFLSLLSRAALLMKM